LFENRRLFIQGDFYKELYIKINKIIDEHFLEKQISILDLGCGEGIHDINIISRLNEDYKLIGIDFNKKAIEMASDYYDENKTFIVGDVNKLPIKSNKIDLILNILSPYYSNEALRVLNEEGIMIKVIPGEKYLIELRNILGFSEYEKYEQVKNNVLKKFDLIQEIKINEKKNLKEEEFNQLVNMTPLTKSKKINNEEYKKIKEITINLNILVLQRKVINK
jgi:ubiquinone/menaquinone biosynthesis C-methylase UbiE